jgi:aspartyl-tRNA(Asn)/glutamyl-tRNA(Gln) amidotransferase subunit C
MEVDRNLILKLENLTRLELSEGERTKVQGSLNDILKMVDKLNELNTEGVEPLVYVNEEITSLREDKVSHELTQKQALQNAPNHNEKYFKVPKVIDL